MEYERKTSGKACRGRRFPDCIDGSLHEPKSSSDVRCDDQALKRSQRVRFHDVVMWRWASPTDEKFHQMKRSRRRLGVVAFVTTICYGARTQRCGGLSRERAIGIASYDYARGRRADGINCMNVVEEKAWRSARARAGCDRTASLSVDCSCSFLTPPDAHFEVSRQTRKCRNRARRLPVALMLEPFVRVTQRLAARTRAMPGGTSGFNLAPCVVNPPPPPGDGLLERLLP